MRFVITGEWDRNRLLQTIVALYSVYVIGLWVTNALLYFSKMSLYPSSVVEYYLGADNLRLVAKHTIIVGLGAIGMTFVIVSGGIDLSIGSVIALAAVVTALAFNAEGDALAIAASYVGEEGDKPAPADAIFVRAVDAAEVTPKPRS